MDTQTKKPEKTHARQAHRPAGRRLALPLGALLVLLLTTIAHAQTAAAPATPPRAVEYSARALAGAADAALAAGHPGAAIVELERARLLAPRSPELATRLAHARELANVPPVQEGRLGRLARLLSGRSWCDVALAGLVLGGVGVTLLSWGVRRRRGTLALALAGVAVAPLALLGAWSVTPSRADAVVVAAAEPARIAPFAAAEPAFTVAEGAAVTVTGRHGDYVLVSAPDGQGWLPRSSVERILP